MSKPTTGLGSWELWQRLLLFATIGIVILVAGLAITDVAVSAGKVHPGVTVGGVDVGGMNPEAASAALEKQLPIKAKVPVTVTYQKQTWPITAADLDVTFAYGDLVDAAMLVGREDALGRKVSRRIASWAGNVHLPAPVVADKPKLDALLEQVAREVDVAPRDASLTIKGTDVTLNPAAEGVTVNRPKLSRALLAAFTQEQRRVPIETVTASVKVTDAGAGEAKAVVETMLSKPVTVKLQKQSWTFSAEEIAEMIAFRTVESSASAGSAELGWTLQPFVSASEASKTVPSKLGSGIGKPAVDAKFKTSNGRVSIVPSRDGVGPDIATLADDMTTVLTRESTQDRVVVLTTRTAEPKLTTEKARDMGVVERISTYTTTYPGGNRARVNNIHTLGDALDGKLVAPGDTFSFNGSVGERTAAKGYQEAGAIVDGKLVQQLGGGICQVGTTLFNAIFLSGLPVKERHNHSFYISHYPKGRDATVSWGGPDLKFVNETEKWVMISVSYTNSSITISLYGTDPGYEVTSKSGEFTNSKAFGTETFKDPKLGTGIKVIDDGGITGRTCVVTRTVRKGGKVVRTDTFKSVYRPKTQIVRVGTKPAKSTSGSSGGN